MEFVFHFNWHWENWTHWISHGGKRKIVYIETHRLCQAQNGTTFTLEHWYVCERHTQNTIRKRKTGHGRRCVVCWSCHNVGEKNLYKYSTRTHTCSDDENFPCAIYATSTLLLSIFSQFQRYEICAYDSSNQKHNTTTLMWAQPIHSWVMCFIHFSMWMNVVSFSVRTYPIRLGPECVCIWIFANSKVEWKFWKLWKEFICNYNWLGFK